MKMYLDTCSLQRPLDNKVRDSHGKRPLRAFFSTEPAQAALSIIADFVNRWPLEVISEEARTHLGLET